MKIPPIGLGTWELRGEACTDTVKDALDLGYRHIDTAYLYFNHEAIAKAIEGFDRAQLFLTSKIAIQEQVDKSRPEYSVEKACEQALQELRCDYLDLYLIHAPDRSYPLAKILGAIEKLAKTGKVRHAGVSNFTIHHLEDLAKEGWTPFANQVEYHPYLNQEALLDYCKRHGIELVSYRPFGKGKLLKEEPLLNTIGAKHGKTAAQVILRWLNQKGIPAIPKASSKQHLKENIELQFTLSHEEMAALNSLDQNKRYCKPDLPEHQY